MSQNSAKKLNPVLDKDIIINRLKKLEKSEKGFESLRLHKKLSSSFDELFLWAAGVRTSDGVPRKEQVILYNLYINNFSVIDYYPSFLNSLEYLTLSMLKE